MENKITEHLPDVRNKMTAVEWLYDTIIIFPESIEDLAHNARSFKQAQQMEKEQIMDAWDKGDYCIDLPDGSWKQKYESGEQYYNETYGEDNG